MEGSGPGIPKEERERVFDHSFRIVGSQASSSGLGLSIIKAIAERPVARLTLGKSNARAAGRNSNPSYINNSNCR